MSDTLFKSVKYPENKPNPGEEVFITWGDNEKETGGISLMDELLENGWENIEWLKPVSHISNPCPLCNGTGKEIPSFDVAEYYKDEDTEPKDELISNIPVVENNNLLKKTNLYNLFKRESGE